MIGPMASMTHARDFGANQSDISKWWTLCRRKRVCRCLQIQGPRFSCRSPSFMRGNVFNMIKTYVSANDIGIGVWFCSLLLERRKWRERRKRFINWRYLAMGLILYFQTRNWICFGGKFFLTGTFPKTFVPEACLHWLTPKSHDYWTHLSFTLEHKHWAHDETHRIVRRGKVVFPAAKYFFLASYCG